MFELFSGLRSDESGVTSMEYAIIAALLAIGIIAGVPVVGGRINQGYTNVGTNFADTMADAHARSK